MNTLAASTLPYLNIPFAEAINRIENLGFDGIEIYFEGKHSLPANKIIDALSTYDFKLFLHAPFSDLNIASFNETVLEESKRQIKDSLEIAKEIGAKLATVHFGRYSPLGLSYPKSARERNLESISGISDFATALGLDVAFENAPSGFGTMCGSLEVLTDLVTEAEIKITLDMGHAHTWENQITEFITGLNSSIAHVHLHDNTGDSDMHLCLGEGEIDYQKVFRALSKINYKKALCLELLYEEDLKSSKEKIGPFLDDMK
jgi:sugar phosphate isomerase/epimerase